MKTSECSCGRSYSITVNGKTFPLSYEECVDILAKIRHNPNKAYMKEGKVAETLTEEKLNRIWEEIPVTNY